MRKRSNYTISYCMCPNCGKGFPIPRMGNRVREKGHKKDLWCPFCKETVTMSEMRDCDFCFRVGGKNGFN